MTAIIATHSLPNNRCCGVPFPKANWAAPTSKADSANKRWIWMNAVWLLNRYIYKILRIIL